MLKLEKIANIQFLNIGIGRGDFEGVDEADEAIQVFNRMIKSRKELDAALDQQEESNLFPNVENLSKQFSDEFDVTIEQAEEILTRGFTGIREFLTLESLADPTVFKRADDLFNGYIQNIGAASNQAILGSDKMSESNQELVRSFARDSIEIRDIMKGRRAVSKQDINSLMLGVFEPEKVPTFRKDSGVIKAIDQINRETGNNYGVADFINKGALFGIRNKYNKIPLGLSDSDREQFLRTTPKGKFEETIKPAIIEQRERIKDQQSELPKPQLPIPNVPMPNVSPVAVTVNPNTGLTRTETALLSPTEQIIAARNKGGIMDLV